MGWFFFALLSVVTLAGSEVSQKIALTRKVDISPITNNGYIWLLQGTGGVIIALTLGQFAVIQGFEGWLKLGILAIIYFIGGTAFYSSYKSNSPSVSIVLGSISVIVSTILGIIIFNETTSFVKFIGISLILFAILVLNLKGDKFKIDKYNSYAILGGFCFGIAFTLDKSFVLDLNPFAYLGFMSLSVGVVSFILKPKHIIKETQRLKPIDFTPMFVIAFFGILFNLFSFISYDKGGNVGVVDAINNSAVFLVILAEVFLLKDRKDLPRKLIAASTAVVGIFLLAFV